MPAENYLEAAAIAASTMEGGLEGLLARLGDLGLGDGEEAEADEAPAVSVPTPAPAHHVHEDVEDEEEEQEDEAMAEVSAEDAGSLHFRPQKIRRS